MLRRTLLERAAAACPVVPVADADVDEEETEEDASGAETAVVDSVEDGVAVVLFDDGRGRRVDAEVLPPAAREEGLVIRVPGGDALALARPDRAATRRRRREAASRFDDLAERPPGDEGHRADEERHSDERSRSEAGRLAPGRIDGAPDRSRAGTR